MNQNTLSVEAIKDGTVIDHIPVGQGLTILRQFKLLHSGNAVTVGFNLSSQSNGSKDIIKISGLLMDDAMANRLALFAPRATVNDIADFKVVRKRTSTLPDTISEVFSCPNSNCASHGEPVKSQFYVRINHGETRLRCHYCEKTFARKSVIDA